MDILDDLAWRGLIHQCTDLEGLRAQLASGPVTLYCGFDPTADSLHVGSLIPLVTLCRFALQGHRPLALVGGATGMVGDPSGKTTERTLQTAEDAAARADALTRQLTQILDMPVVNNLEWTGNMSVLDFLRDVGKHFSVSAMLTRDSVRERLGREGEGISLTEFVYMLLQANDFAALSRDRDCSLQIGGSDQWGNMCSGIDFIRRTQRKGAFALTMPLLLNREGEKFGKTAGGAVWLSEAKTAAWDFYQFWLNVEDEEVIKLCKLLTFRSQEEIAQLAAATETEPHRRLAQAALAMDVTAFVHGDSIAHQMKEAASILFGKGGDLAALTDRTLDRLTDSLPTLWLKDDMTLGDALVDAQLEPSKSRAQKVCEQAAVSVNQEVQANSRALLKDMTWLHGRFLLIKKGKKHFALIRRHPEAAAA